MAIPDDPFPSGDILKFKFPYPPFAKGGTLR